MSSPEFFLPDSFRREKKRKSSSSRGTAAKALEATQKKLPMPGGVQGLGRLLKQLEGQPHPAPAGVPFTEDGKKGGLHMAIFGGTSAENNRNLMCWTVKWCRPLNIMMSNDFYWWGWNTNGDIVEVIGDDID